MADLQALARHYDDVIDRYRELADLVAAELANLVRSAGLTASVVPRLKERNSYVLKAIRKQYSDPVSQIRDLAGVRVTALDVPTAAAVCVTIQDNWQLVGDDKAGTLPYDRLGYLGVHYDLTLPSGRFPQGQPFADMSCEIQVHTQAQNLWANTAHSVVYKPERDVPAALRRRIYRLVVLAELFDDEVSGARAEMNRSLPEAKILEAIRPWHERVIGAEFDAQASLETLQWLSAAYSTAELAGVTAIFDEFFASNHERLVRTVNEFALGYDGNPFFGVPEGLVVFERLHNDKPRVLAVWEEHLPVQPLQQLADAFGVGL